MTSSSRRRLRPTSPCSSAWTANIDGAARDVQAAINAARVDLPATLRSNPTYQQVNPADAPIMILAMTSPTKTPGQIYDAASNIVQQQLSQVKGVGEVDIGGASLPAVRVELNPTALSHYGIGLEDVRAALASANANRPKGVSRRPGCAIRSTPTTPASWRPTTRPWSSPIATARRCG